MKLALRAPCALLPLTLLIACGSAKAAPPAVVAPAPGKALVVFHTRVAAEIPLPEGRLSFRPYDRATGRVEGNGFDARGDPFTAGRWIGLMSNKSMRNWKGWAIEIEPGSYVLASVENPNLSRKGDSMFPFAWAFDAAPGTVTYIGDFTLRWTRLARGWSLDIVPEFDEPRARAFAAARTPAEAPFVAAPVRPVELSRNSDRSWMARDSR